MMRLGIHLSKIERVLRRTTIHQFLKREGLRTAQRGTPDGSAPSDPVVVVCANTYAAEVKASNVDRTLIF